MNTLSRQYTSKFFSSAADYVAFRAQWSKLINSEHKQELKAVHHLIYLVLCGKDWRKAFPFPTNHNKIDNGYQPELYRALLQFHSTYLEQKIIAPFGGLVTHAMLVEARKLIAAPQVAGGQIVSDAYAAPELTAAER